MKVKAKDIAKAAGVSTTAVSLVLNGKDSRISEATKEKILRISREMAFQSEITVQPGGSQRVKTLGLVLPDLKDPVFYKLLIYIQEYAFQKGYMVFFCACGDDAERCCTIVEGLVVKNVDGLAVVAPSTLEKDDSLTKTLHTIQDNGVPLVLLDRAVYSIFSDFVTTDNKYGGRAQVYTTKKRYQGFQEGVALIKAHYREQDVFHGSFTEESGRTAFETLYAQGCDGFFVENDMMAKGVLAAAKEKGIHIGENCKFAVYDYEGTENVISVRQNLSLMAEKAIDRLIERIEEPEKLMPAGNFYITPLVEN